MAIKFNPNSVQAHTNIGAIYHLMVSFYYFNIHKSYHLPYMAGFLSAEWDQRILHFLIFSPLNPIVCESFD